MNHIILPQELRPRDGRFGPGPSKVRPEALEALAATGRSYLGTSHRRNGVRSMVNRVRSGLNELFALPDGYEVLLGNGGATAFWDAAAFRLIERRSLHYVFGEFSSKFASVAGATPFLDDPIVVEAPLGSHPDPVAAEVDTYALIHNETSTGVSMDVARSAPDGLVLVDATSAAGVLPVDPGEFDAYYFSPQKAFAADGGLWVSLCSPAALDRIEQLAATRWAPPILDLQKAAANARKDQTLNTPALATLFLLADQTEWLLERGGMSWAAARAAEAAALVYGWAERGEFTTPFVAEPDHRSATVATIDLDDAVVAGDLTAALRANGIVDIESYRGLQRNQIRIGMFPAVDLEDLERLLGAVDWMIEQIGA